MFIIDDLETVFHTYYVGTYMIYSRTKVYIPNFCGSLVIAIRSKAKENLRTAVKLFFTVYKKKFPNKRCIFSEYLLLYIISDT
jgi:hypothetical protein